MECPKVAHAYSVKAGFVYFLDDKIGWYDKDGNLLCEIASEQATALLKGQHPTYGRVPL